MNVGDPQPGTPPPSSFALALHAFLTGLGRLLIIVILIGLMGAAFYYALPLVYRELVLPVRETSARLDALSQQISTDRAAMNEQLKAVQMRLNQLETASAGADAKTADNQSGLTSLRNDLSVLQVSMTRLEQLEKDLKALDTRQGQTQAQMATSEQGLRAPGGKIDSLRRDVEMLKAMNLLTRAEVNMAQNNFGLAKNDILAARDVLLVTRSSLSEEEQSSVSAWITRLDLALANLPAYPLIAVNDLEAAYQMVAAGVLPAAPTPGPITPTATPWISPTPYETPTPSPTVYETPTPWITPTPSPTVYQTATPWITPTSKP